MEQLVNDFRENAIEKILLLPCANKTGEIPSISGVYFLVNNETDEIIYIGQSANIKKRWQSRRDFSLGERYRLHYWEMSWTESCDVNEALMIALIRPLFNKRINCWVGHAPLTVGGRYKLNF